MAISDIVVQIAPELAGEPLLDDFIGFASSMLTAPRWGARFSLAVSYLTAHLMTMASVAVSSGGTSGAITSKKAGDLAESYGSTVESGSSDGWLGETKYGRAFIYHRGSRSAGAPRVVTI